MLPNHLKLKNIQHSLASSLQLVIKPALITLASQEQDLYKNPQNKPQNGSNNEMTRKPFNNANVASQGPKEHESRSLRRDLTKWCSK